MMHPVTVSPRNGEKGFTLVEMSIVLVIIGLIIGGVLVGQDLIRQAETTALIGQIQEYDTAMHTFKTKYGTLPGDLPSASSVLPATTGITLASGDGNGFLSDAPNASGGGTGTGFTSPTTTAGEIVQVWAHLSTTGMIEGLFTGVSGTVTFPVAGSSAANFPSLKTGRGGIVAFGNAPDAFNYYWLGLTTSASSTLATAANLRPDEAYGIDKKLDDGLPTSGNVMGSGNASPAASTGWVTTTAATCFGTSSGGASIYLTATTNYTCQVRVKMN